MHGVRAKLRSCESDTGGGYGALLRDTLDVRRLDEKCRGK